MLKKLLLLGLLAPQILYSQTAVKNLKSEVKRATVFTQGAELFYTERVDLAVGMTEVAIEGVSPHLIANTIQAGTTGDVVVTEVRYHLFYAEAAPIKPDDPAKKRLERDLKSVTDSIQLFAFDRKGINMRMNNFSSERNIVVNNRMMKGEFQKDSLRLFTQSLDFLRQRLNEIDAEMLKLERELSVFNTLINRLEERRNKLQTLLNGNYQPDVGTPVPIPQVIVTLYCERAQSTELTFHYFVENAGWYSTYDVRAKNNVAELELMQKAELWQQTDLNWKNVRLTLSTGNPHLNQSKPVLQPFYVGRSVPVAGYANKPVPSANSNNVLADAKVKENTTDSDDLRKREEESEPAEIGVEEYTTVSENMLRVEYDIAIPYNIASDGQPHRVQIQNKKVPATFVYSCVPKLDLDAFLLARVANWEDLNLIPGTANIYFDGSLVGKSELSALTQNDTLQINLGRDKSIAIKRTKLKDKSKEKMLSDARVVTTAYEISVRNTKSYPIRLVIEDQMPVSNDNAVKVEYLEYGKARFNENTGKLTWELKLDAKSSKSVDFAYEVKWPK
jgi:uncharacterized protein (TIGR02231 family)